jgi:hypothetical protein
MRVVFAKSTRKTKKYMALFDDGSITHFGGEGCGDFIRYSSQDPVLARQKRAAYLARHGATETWTDPKTAATLSRFVLWEKPTLKSAILAYKKRFM